MATRKIMQRLYFTFILVLLYYTSPSTASKRSRYVTCNSVVKLMNVQYNVRLHSHDIKYGSGSGQQSVTGTKVKEDGNSYWLIKGPTGKTCVRGKPISCGDIIRLEHIATKKNLHSHHFPSPLSDGQEVSAYGDFQGEGDTGDHWEVICNTEFWEKTDPIYLNHVDTDKRLTASGHAYTSLINGQIEIVGIHMAKGDASRWKAMEGMFIHPTEPETHHHEHTEL
ncbi:stromal cell-derived factor 2 [Venturia canescens]|uniref:stromal cell-derived factor 2 n=1 Tax=Venturia canescens TaxID=32260 RepID=UPI001C9C48E2|nr:stromal cell-derived factor 2 [Venturia canescens]